ncbi:unnamed protein product [Allacma fusca]|uniref:Transcription initiation factor TFIID subunit 1 n=1 Tax=Allacma fusca TaxID=39272 RepID=A0A8J2NVC2_9HEXA|nr:unnamed protein product [Allacma fusca]
MERVERDKMSDSDDDMDSGGQGVNLAGFLFGNIDTKTGQLEGDVLDEEAQRHLNALQKLGLGSMMEQVMLEEGKVQPSKPQRKSKLLFDDSDSDDDDDDDDGDGVSNNYNRSGSGQDNAHKSAQDLDDDYDEDEKSPSAVDFFDIAELADEDLSASMRSMNSSSMDTTDYDEDDGSLMPPPPVPPAKGAKLSDGSFEKKLETPLAAMLPSKYVGINITTVFPDFRPDKILRFARLFGPGKPGSLPQWWKNVKKRRKKKKAAEGASAEELASDERDEYGWQWHYGEDPPDINELTPEEKEFLSKLEPTRQSKDSDDKSDKKKLADQYPKTWRHGPAAIWYDMLGISPEEETLDYGFKLKPPADVDADDEESDEEILKIVSDKKLDDYCDEVFHMVTQTNWESNIIWDGTDLKHKKLNKNLAAGWVPSGVNRTAQNFSQPGKNNPPNSPAITPSGKSSGSSVTLPPTSGSSKSQKSSKHDESLSLGNQQDDTWYSIFPVETGELVHGRWEDEVIWDTESMEYLPKPKVLSIDPNDDNVVLCIPDDVDPNAAQGTVAPVKVKIPHPHVKKSKILLGKAGVINVIEEDSPPPSPKNDDKDPYNISNDEYYQPKHTEQSMLKISASGNIIQHSTPVVELRAPFIPTHMGAVKLRNFHRPPIKKYSYGPLASPGPHVILPLAKHIKKKSKQREQERLAAGGGDIFFMRTPEDLTGKDGSLLLLEYCEEHPPLLNQVGMCSKIKNYYKRKAGKDSGPPESNYGETTYAHTSPFLGAMHPGETIQTIENNMYRAPIYEHRTPKTDFVVIRTRNNYFIREYDSLFTVGQECPLYEVPGPNSKRANNFVRDFLQVFIYRLFWKSRDSPRRIKMDDIKRAFPMHSESSIRKRLKLCADFKRTGVDSNWWVIKPEFRLPTEEEIRAMVSPEQCCAYFSLIAAEQRLKDAGYGEKFLFAPQDDDDEENQGKIDDEVKVAPWNTTRAYIQAMKGKCLLQLVGPADPTGCGEGFSYIRVPNKPQTSKEEQEAQPKRIVTGTDADLRRLSLNNAKALLRKFGVPEEEIKKLSRWEVIDVVRTLSTEKAKAGEKGMTKFSRGNRFSVAEHQERYKEECQRIFELQNRVLASHEVLSTDEGESSEDELSDIEEMGKSIENMLSNKKTSSQLNYEKEEQERRELQQMIMGEGKKEEEKQTKKNRKKDDELNSTLTGLVNHPGRVLKIHRTFKNSDGKEFSRTEIVRKAAIIDIYMRIRTTKDENFIRQFALMDDQAKEEMKKEKRRLQEQLRRIKRNQEKESTKKEPQRKKKIKLKPELKMRCGACGQVGHMKTNKACPLYQKNNSPVPPLNVALTEEQEEEIEREIIKDDVELVKIDGTKLQISGRVFKHAEEVKRRSLLIKVPRDAVGVGAKQRKKRVDPSPHCDYLQKKGKTTNRRRVDPQIVMAGIFENILNEMKSLPQIDAFLMPVSAKIALPSYFDKIKCPMDLQTIREKIRAKKYHVGSEFLNDVKLIYDNSFKFNGENSDFTMSAQAMYNLCKERLSEQASKLGKLERLINPLLDDDDQKGLNYILETHLLGKIKTMKEASPFLKPVNKKTVKDYYEIIRKPMDLETIHKKIKNNKYHSRYDFLADMELIQQNADKYNGTNSTFSEKAKVLLSVCHETFKDYNDKLNSIENNIQKSRVKSKDQDDTMDDDEEDDELNYYGGDDDGHDELDFSASRGDQEEGEDEFSRSAVDSTQKSMREEEEEGEYFSDEEEIQSARKKMRLSQETDEDQQMDEDSQHQQVAQAMVELSQVILQPNRSDPLGLQAQSGGMNNAQTIHDDLLVSDSDNDEGPLWF